MYTDRQFMVPLIYSISTMRAYGTHRPIYLYQFGYRGNHSMSKAFDPNSDTNYGAYYIPLKKLNINNCCYIFRRGAYG